MILKTIKKYFWKRALNARLATHIRTRVSGSLITAKDVFVIYDASEEIQNKQAEEFFLRLKSLDIKVKSLGFARYKIVPHYCIPQLSRQFICQKDLNIFGIPHKPFLNDFLDEEFDLLISLDQDQDAVLQYLAAASMAKFKVGWNHPDNFQWFDYLIGATPGDMPDYFQQLIRYLSIN